MTPQVAKQVKALEKEGSRLKRLVADQALDIQVLKEALSPRASRGAATATGPTGRWWKRRPRDGGC